MGRWTIIVIGVIAGLLVYASTQIVRVDWEPFNTPAKAYRNPIDRIVVATGWNIKRRPPPCFRDAIDEGMEVQELVPTDQCVVMTDSRLWRGFWRADFEGSRFCEEPATRCVYETPGPNIWLNYDRHPSPPGKLYSVEFIGRRTRYEGSYGHMGMSDHEMIVDRMLVIKEVEAPPPPPTEAEMIAYWKACQAAETCRPSAAMNELIKLSE